VSYDAYFGVGEPAKVQLLCGGGQIFLTTSHSPGHGRTLGVSDARLEVLRVGSLHDAFLPDFFDPE
jgi:hypothetical protein